MGCLKKPKRPETEQASEGEKQLVSQFRQQWSNYEQNYRPLEDHQIQQMQEMSSAGEMQQAENVAASRAREAMGPMSALGNSAPGSAQHLQRATALESVQGDAMGTAAALGMEQQEARAASARQRIIDYGIGGESLAASVTSRAAALDASQQANHVAARNHAERTRQSGRDSLFGAALGTAGSLVPAAVDKFQDWGASRTMNNLSSFQDANRVGTPGAYAVG